MASHRHKKRTSQQDTLILEVEAEVLKPPEMQRLHILPATPLGPGEPPEG